MIMNATDWNTALFEKMSDEQDKFRDWLKSQPPEEILHHTYEYTVREDIVMAMEELELTDAQAQALLDSPTPLADVYRYFEKLETGYMDVIRDSIGVFVKTVVEDFSGSGDSGADPVRLDLCGDRLCLRSGAGAYQHGDRPAGCGGSADLFPAKRHYPAGDGIPY